jgi:hypothetical protein
MLNLSLGLTYGVNSVIRRNTTRIIATNIRLESLGRDVEMRHVNRTLDKDSVVVRVISALESREQSALLRLADFDRADGTVFASA